MSPPKEGGWEEEGRGVKGEESENWSDGGQQVAGYREGVGVDRVRSERVPLCIPAKFGLSNHVSPLLPSRTRGADHPDIRSESREMIWQRSNRSSGEGLRGRIRPHRLGFNRSHYHFQLPTPRISSDLPRFDHQWMEKNEYPSRNDYCSCLIDWSLEN